MNVVNVQAQKREQTGKKDSKAVRNAGLVPGVIYGGEEIVHFSVEPLELRPIIYTSNFNLIDIDINGKKHRCFVKDTQFHPVTDAPHHIDMIELVDGKSVIVELPVELKGTSPGVREGGKMVKKIRKIKVKTTPEKLVDRLFVDISGMGLNDSIRIRDIEAVEGIQVMNAPAIPIATVEVPRALKSAAAAAAKEGGEE